jgi:hypothetical protein
MLMSPARSYPSDANVQRCLVPVEAHLYPRGKGWSNRKACVVFELSGRLAPSGYELFALSLLAIKSSEPEKYVFSSFLFFLGPIFSLVYLR